MKRNPYPLLIASLANPVEAVNGNSFPGYNRGVKNFNESHGHKAVMTPETVDIPVLKDKTTWVLQGQEEAVIYRSDMVKGSIKGDDWWEHQVGDKTEMPVIKKRFYSADFPAAELVLTYNAKTGEYINAYHNGMMWEGKEKMPQLLLNPGGRPKSKTNLITKGGNMKHWRLSRTMGKNSMLAGSIYRNPSFGFGRPQYSLLKNPGLAIKDAFAHPFTMDNLKALPSIVVGGIGTAVIPSHTLLAWTKMDWLKEKSWANLLIGNTANLILLGTGAKLAFKNKPGVFKNVILGGLTATGLQVAVKFFRGLAVVPATQTEKPSTLQTTAKKLADSITMAGLGAGDGDDALRAKVREAVQRQLMAGLPESVSMVSTVSGRPEAVTAFKTVGQPKSVTAFTTVGGGDDLTDDNLNY